jgi:D-alanine-D-alanine ligase-like ATP-grasp enzyme
MKKILILGGGFSKERAISLVTSKRVLKALKKKNIKQSFLNQMAN